MTDPTSPAGPRLGADALNSDEREVQQALGLTSPPAPRLTDAAFAARVQDARHSTGRRWAFASVPLAAAAAFGLFIGVPEPAPPAASGAELYALTASALDDDSWDDDTFDALLAEPYDEQFDEDDGDSQDSLNLAGDEPLSTALTTLTDGEVIAAFDDDDLAFLDELLDEELAD